MGTTTSEMVGMKPTKADRKKFDEMMDMRKSFKPDGKKDVFGRMPKWIDGVTNGNAGTTGTLTRAKARQIKNKYKNLTIKRFVETDKAPYYKLEDV